VAAFLDADTGSGEREGYHIRIRSGSYDEVVLEPALIAVVHEVDARILVRVADPRERRNAGSPLRGIFANEIVGLAREFVFLDGPGGVGADERHANRCADVRLLCVRPILRARWPLPLQGQHGLSRSQEQAVAGASGDELGSRGALASVLL